MRSHQGGEADRDLQVQLSRLKTSHSTSYSSIDIEPDEDSESQETHAALNACMFPFEVGEEPWFLDSGASSHVIGKPNVLIDTSHSSISSIRTAGGQVLPVKYKGHVSFSDHEVKTVQDVLYVPGVQTNLLSVGRFVNLGHTILFKSNTYLIYNITYPERVFLQAHRDRRTKLYKLTAKSNSISIPSPVMSASGAPKVSAETIDL